MPPFETLLRIAPCNLAEACLSLQGPKAAGWNDGYQSSTYFQSRGTQPIYDAKNSSHEDLTVLATSKPSQARRKSPRSLRLHVTNTALVSAGSLCLGGGGGGGSICRKLLCADLAVQQQCPARIRRRLRWCGQPRTLRSPAVASRPTCPRDRLASMLRPALRMGTPGGWCAQLLASAAAYAASICWSIALPGCSGKQVVEAIDAAAALEQMPSRVQAHGCRLRRCPVCKMPRARRPPTALWARNTTTRHAAAGILLSRPMANPSTASRACWTSRSTSRVPQLRLLPRRGYSSKRLLQASSSASTRVCGRSER